MRTQNHIIVSIDAKTAFDKIDLKPENLLYATPAPDAPLKIGENIS